MVKLLVQVPMVGKIGRIPLSTTSPLCRRAKASKHSAELLCNDLAGDLRILADRLHAEADRFLTKRGDTPTAFFDRKADRRNRTLFLLNDRVNNISRRQRLRKVNIIAAGMGLIMGSAIYTALRLLFSSNGGWIPASYGFFTGPAFYLLILSMNLPGKASDSDYRAMRRQFGKAGDFLEVIAQCARKLHWILYHSSATKDPAKRSCFVRNTNELSFALRDIFISSVILLGESGKLDAIDKLQCLLADCRAHLHRPKSELETWLSKA